VITLKTVEALDSEWNADDVVFFGYDTSSPASFAAQAQVVIFCDDHPEVRVCQVDVRESRPVWQEIVRRTHAHEETLLVLRRGSLRAFVLLSLSVTVPETDSARCAVRALLPASAGPLLQGGPAAPAE
jgi:hypothetical protein